MRENKILIVGVSAVGKSMFARKLGEKIGLLPTHMDAIMWQPGWKYIGNEETVQKIREIIKGPKWLLEGFIHKSVIKEVLDASDLILYLDYPRWLLFSRYLKRSWQHRKETRPEMPGCPDRFSFEFLLRILKKKEVYWLERELGSGNYEAKLRIIKSPTEAAVLLNSFDS